MKVAFVTLFDPFGAIRKSRSDYYKQKCLEDQFIEIRNIGILKEKFLQIFKIKQRLYKLFKFRL